MRFSGCSYRVYPAMLAYLDREYVREGKRIGILALSVSIE
jgi:hypothetical protein